MAQDEKALVATKPKRPYKPKVRTGCITCKIRRVKCNEAKPACLQCTSTGRTCDGYAPPRALLFEVSRDQAERRSFHYFRQRTAPELQCEESICTDRPFWDGFVLRASYSREVVRHATAAMGSFHESLELDSGPQAVAAHAFAFEQYNKAINVLTRGDSLPLEDVLMACILFTWFENLQGSFAISLDHLKSGIKILETWRSDSKARPQRSGATAATINDDLGPLIDRLKLQAAIFLDSVDRGGLLPCSASLPDIFLSYTEAHNHFYEIFHWICHELEMGLKKRDPEFVQEELVPVVIWKLDQWLKLLQQYIDKDTKESERAKELDRYWKIKSELHLKIQHCQATIMLNAFPYDLESRFDGQLQYFRDIVSLSQRFIDVMNEEALNTSDLNQNRPLGVFERDHAIIPSLFLTACRCRDPQIRREAVAVLRRRHWREGIWDSGISARMAEYLMLLEETGLGEIQSCHDVPESSRLYLIGCTFFASNADGKQLQLKWYNNLSAEWTTFGAKLHCLRSGSSVFTDGIEDFWWTITTGNMTPPIEPERIISRDVGGGLFPQLTKSTPRLWSVLNRGNAIRCMGRFASPTTFRSHSQKPTADGDVITLVGQFSEYMSTDRPWPGLGTIHSEKLRTRLLKC